MNFVTGGTGILGNQLLVDLLKKGESIRALRRDTSNIEPLKQLLASENLSDSLHKIEWVEGELDHTGLLLEYLSEVKRIFHCAALVSFNPRDQKQMEKTNIIGTQNLVNCALQKGVQEFVHVSSTAAIGKQKKGITITENQNWDAGAKNSYYSLSKYFGELEVWRGQEEGLNVIVVNPSVIIGPGNWGKSSTSVFPSVWKGLKFYTKGSNAFVDVRDVSKAMLLLSEKKVYNQRFLLVSENISFKAFFDMVAKALGKKPPSIKSSKVMSSIAWRLNAIWSLITGSKPLITKETARAAMAKQVYSNQKIKDAIGIEFIPVKKAVERTARLFLEKVKG